MQYFLLVEISFKILALHNTSTVDDSNFLEHCLPEIALTTTSTFIFSLPTAISFSPLGVSYSAFTTLSAAASSTVKCAYTNKSLLHLIMIMYLLKFYLM